MSQLGRISGSSETVDGVRAWPQSWPQVVTRSLCQWMIRPPLRQDMACSVVKRSPQPSQRGGSAVGGVIPRRRRAPSRNSSAERSDPLRRVGKVVSQAPVFAERLMRRLSSGLAVARMVDRISSLVKRRWVLASRRPMAAVRVHVLDVLRASESDVIFI